MRSLLRKSRGEQTDATIVQVTMTERLSYGEAQVRVTYRVEPAEHPAFEAVREAPVKMKFLPQAGQRVRVLYDPTTRELLQVITQPGQEVAPPAGFEATKEIPWNDSGHARLWADGTRRH